MTGVMLRHKGSGFLLKPDPFLLGKSHLLSEIFIDVSIVTPASNVSVLCEHSAISAGFIFKLLPYKPSLRLSDLDCIFK